MSKESTSLTDEEPYHNTHIHNIIGNNNKTLIGRKKEVSKLLSIFYSIQINKTYKCVWVHGISGSGKTSLVTATMREANCFFCTGKFFSSENPPSSEIDPPYSAIMTAFSDLCEFTLQNFTEERCKEIQNELGTEGRVLLNSITNISPFLPDEDNNGNDVHNNNNNHVHNNNNNNISSTSTSTSTSKITEEDEEIDFVRFTIACKRFLLAMTSSIAHPVVLFLDDIQWMDEKSKRLIEMLFLTDSSTEIRNLMLILAYRDEEECNNSLVESLVKKSQNRCQQQQSNNNTTVVESGNSDVAFCEDLHIKALSLDAVSQLVSMELGEEENLSELCALIARKTQGNPFHVLQFLSIIRKDRDGKFDLDLIRKQTILSDSLITLLSNKAKSSSIDSIVQQILKIASLLGQSFKVDMITALSIEYFNNSTDWNNRKKKIMDESSSISSSPISNTTQSNDIVIYSFLQNAVSEQYLEEIRDGEYQFSHDKIKSVFQTLISLEDKKELHLMIAKEYIKDDDLSSMYRAAIHMNCATTDHMELMNNNNNNDGSNHNTPLIHNNCIKWARVYLFASKYCECNRSAFAESASLLQDGLALIEDNLKWSSSVYFDLVFEMTESLARMKFIIGDIDGCKIANDELLLRAMSIKQKLTPLTLQIEIQITSKVLKNTTFRLVLKQLNVSYPRVVTPLNLFRKLKRVRSILKNTTDEQILNLPLMVNPQLSTAILVMIQVQYYYYFVPQKKLLAIYISLRAIELSLSHGLSQYSANAFLSYGITEMILGNIDIGNRLGMLSLKLLSFIPCKYTGCTVLGSTAFCILAQKQRLRKLLEPIPQALNEALEVGSIVHASVCLLEVISIRLVTGDNLYSLGKFARNILYQQRINELDNKVISQVKCLLQLILNLQCEDYGTWKDATLLNGEIMNEDQYKSVKGRDSSTFYFCKMFLNFMFGFYKEAHMFGKKICQSFLVKSCVALSTIFEFYYSLSSYRCYEIHPRRRKYLRTARRYRRLVRRRHRNGNPNATPCYRLLEVEELRHTSDEISELSDACTLAIELQMVEGYSHLEALANEQAGRIFGALRCYAADRYLNKAIFVYKNKWGATAKGLWLQAAHKYYGEGRSHHQSKSKNNNNNNENNISSVPHEVFLSNHQGEDSTTVPSTLEDTEPCNTSNLLFKEKIRE